MFHGAKHLFIQATRGRKQFKILADEPDSATEPEPTSNPEITNDTPREPEPMETDNSPKERDNNDNPLLLTSAPPLCCSLRICLPPQWFYESKHSTLLTLTSEICVSLLNKHFLQSLTWNKEAENAH